MAREQTVGEKLKPIIYRWLPWMLLGVVLLPAVATVAVGIVMLALWEESGDIAFGVLTIVFSFFALTGAITTIVLIARQNRLALLQTEFIAKVSHELRTPMSSIRMYVDTLRLGRFRTAEERDSCYLALQRETRRLAALVEKLLDFRAHTLARTQAPNVTLVDPRELAQAVVERISPQAEERLSLVVEPALPHCEVNRDDAVDALSNLVKNGLTHGGPEGQVVLTVRSDAQGVAFHVRDTGPGLTKKEQKRVFRRFYRTSITAQSGVPGFGLGLSIVADFARSHGGRVSVRSNPGQGSTFTIWLPAANPPPASASEPPSSSPHSAPAPQRSPQRKNEEQEDEPQ
jgi:two-component system phosphate regulon sensor histidine kinase PhoR